MPLSPTFCRKWGEPNFGGHFVPCIKFLPVSEIWERLLFLWVRPISKHRWPKIPPSQFLKTHQPLVLVELSLNWVLATLPCYAASNKVFPSLFFFVRCNFCLDTLRALVCHSVSFLRSEAASFVPMKLFPNIQPILIFRLWKWHQNFQEL